MTGDFKGLTKTDDIKSAHGWNKWKSQQARAGIGITPSRLDDLDDNQREVVLLHSIANEFVHVVHNSILDLICRQIGGG